LDAHVFDISGQKQYKRTLTTKNEKMFEIKQPEQNLKGTAIRGSFLTTAAQACQFVLQMGSTVILARLLTPEDYGLIAMVGAVTSVLSYFGDLGLSDASIQKVDISSDQLSSLFWLNVAAGATFAIVAAGLAPVLSWFYHEPRLLLIAPALAISFIFGGLAVQHCAVLKRQMHFRGLVSIQIASTLTGALVGIIAAVLGAGYWSLVLMEISTMLATAVGAWLMCNWRPGFYVRRCGMRPLITFGANVSGHNLLRSLTLNLDKIVIGKWWGSQQLGLYSKAYQLLTLPLIQLLVPLGKVAVPTLSRLQEDKGRYQGYYRKIVSLIAYGIMPLSVAVAALAEEIILIVLGARWLESARIFRILAISALVQPIASANTWVCISTGHTKNMMQWAMMSTPMVCAAFFVGLPWGALGVAWAYTTCMLLIQIPGCYIMLKDTPISVRDVVGSSWRPTVLSIILFVTMSVIRQSLAIESPVAKAAITSFFAAVSFLVFLALWPKARSEVSELLALRRYLKNSDGVGTDVT